MIVSNFCGLLRIHEFFNKFQLLGLCTTDMSVMSKVCAGTSIILFYVASERKPLMNSFSVLGNITINLIACTIWDYRTSLILIGLELHYLISFFSALMFKRLDSIKHHWIWTKIFIYVQVILFEIDCAIFYTNLHKLFCQLISWTNWVNFGKFMDNCWISCKVMADMENIYDHSHNYVNMWKILNLLDDFLFHF